MNEPAQTLAQVCSRVNTTALTRLPATILGSLGKINPEFRQFGEPDSVSQRCSIKRAVRWSADVVLVFTCGCLLTSNGCDGTQAPPKQAAQAERPQYSGTSAPLRALAKAGAWIALDGPSKMAGSGTWIEFRSQEVSPQDVALVRRVSRPVFLGLRQCRLQHGSLAPLDGMPNLRSLTMGGDTIDDVLLSELSELPDLRILRIASPKASARGLTFIRAARKLIELELSGRRMGDDVLRLAHELGNVVSLDLTATAVTDAGLRDISRWRYLERLVLNECDVTDAGLSYLASLPKLRLLALDNTNVSDVSLPLLAQLKSLETLSMENTRITGSRLAALGGCPRLESLDLSKTDVDDTSLGQLVAVTGLESLAIRETAITDAGITKLVPLRRLRGVHASGTKVTAVAKDALPNVMIELPQR